MFVVGEIADALELQVARGGLLGDVLLDVAVGQHGERVGVEQFAEVALVGGGVFHVEEAVVESYLCGQTVGRAHPVERAFHLAIGAFEAAAAFGVLFIAKRAVSVP